MIDSSFGQSLQADLVVWMMSDVRALRASLLDPSTRGKSNTAAGGGLLLAGAGAAEEQGEEMMVHYEEEETCLASCPRACHVTGPGCWAAHYPAVQVYLTGFADAFAVPLLILALHLGT
jgi:hypothetical protein